MPDLSYKVNAHSNLDTTATKTYAGVTCTTVSLAITKPRLKRTHFVEPVDASVNERLIDSGCDIGRAALGLPKQLLDRSATDINVAPAFL